MAISATPQGTLNRIRASVIFPFFPSLSVTSSFLSKRGITITFAGKSTVFLDTMTGRVTSPEPYLAVMITMHLVKSQYLANSYKRQQELLTLLGDCVFRPDAATLQPYSFTNCAIEAAPPSVDASGADADFPVEIGGTYLVNSALFI